MKLYELATLSLAAGTAGRCVEAAAAYAGSGEARGRLLGCFVAEIGALNRIAVLRGFESEADLAAERARALTHTDPFGCGEHLTNLSMESYVPFPGLPPVAPGQFGPFYEMRSYTLKRGGLAPLMHAWAEKLSARMQLSPLTVAMYSLDGPPRIVHIWPYPSLNDRAEIRADAMRRGIWPPGTTAYLADMRSDIYLASDSSPLQ